MLHIASEEIRSLLLQGRFGLEKEGLRVLADGSMARTPNPFMDSHHITMDFSENQTEINTSAEPSAEDAVHALAAYSRQVRQRLLRQERAEYIWPFSNPPFLAGEEDIPVAQFTGADAKKTRYREYLARRYGRYKMTFSGIHVNYSFSEELLQKEFSLRGHGRFRSFRDSFYLELAEKAAAYGWLLVILTAASPVLDGSYYEAAMRGRDVFSGMASVRCSELGYWNAFVPVFDYTNLQRYADGIRQYVDDGLLYSVSELYYPVRVKPRGENSLAALGEDGIDHIELRMYDLNPFAEAGIETADVRFAQLFLVWLASLPRRVISPAEQVLSVQNFKNAARYDLRSARIVMRELTGKAAVNAQEAALYVLSRMRDFYIQLDGPVPGAAAPETDFGADPGAGNAAAPEPGTGIAGGPGGAADPEPGFGTVPGAGNSAAPGAGGGLSRQGGFLPAWVRDVLEYEMDKAAHPEKRYAVRVRRQFSDTFAEKGTRHARLCSMEPVNDADGAADVV
ncbi:MAG: hypothetical protein Q4D81_06760 [Eubacteriales bacterium]|nr:hypothetical protein [Eubacteriales bacterium]